jgi:hypothetical protein
MENVCNNVTSDNKPSLKSFRTYVKLVIGCTTVLKLHHICIGSLVLLYLPCLCSKIEDKSCFSLNDFFHFVKPA